MGRSAILMDIVMHVSSLVFVVLLASGSLASGTVDRSSRSIYQKPIGESRKLQVNVGPLIPKSVLAPLLSERTAKRINGGARVQLTVEADEGGTHEVWSHLFLLEEESQHGEFQVLDILLLPDEILLAFVRPSSMIGIVRIKVGGPAEMTFLNPAKWSLLAALVPASPGG